MNAGRLVWLVCTNPPLLLLGVSDASAAAHGLHAHSSTLHCGSNLASLQLSSCICFSLAFCTTYRFLAFCNATQSEQFLAECFWSIRVFLNENGIYKLVTLALVIVNYAEYTVYTIHTLAFESLTANGNSSSQLNWIYSYCYGNKIVLTFYLITHFYCFIHFS